jgi:hypothetical protein
MQPDDAGLVFSVREMYDPAAEGSEITAGLPLRSGEHPVIGDISSALAVMKQLILIGLPVIQSLTVGADPQRRGSV